MRRRMTLLFKVGFTVIILVSIWLFYFVNSGKHTNSHSEHDEVVKPNVDVVDSADDHVGLDLENFHVSSSKKMEKVSDPRSDSKHANPLESNPVLKANLAKAAESIRIEEIELKKFKQGPSIQDGAVKMENVLSVKQDKVKNTDSLSNKRAHQLNPFQDEYVHLSVVACGDRLEETMVMLKSAVLQARKPLQFHIFAERALHDEFHKQLDSWPPQFKDRTTAHVYPISFPAGQNTEEWKKLFKPCASQRLFIPLILKHIDALLYVDTDVLFMRPIDDVWGHFEKFNSSHIAALAPEHEEASAGWYNRFARHPFYGKLGVNSGVMLMNLTKLRDMNFVDTMIRYHQMYKYNITWGDQDLINILFHFHPDKLYVYECDWNYRPDHCMYMSNCKAAEKNGVSVLHGCRQVFHNDKQPTFKAIYNAFDKFSFGDDLQRLLTLMRDFIKESTRSQCGQVWHLLTRLLENQLKDRQ